MKKINVFGLGYAIVDLWEKMIEVCENIFLKGVKCKIVNLPLSLKNRIIKYYIFLCKFELIKIISNIIQYNSIINLWKKTRVSWRTNNLHVKF